MTTPAKYVNEMLVGWMEDNQPLVLAELRSNDVAATTAALLGWMARYAEADLRAMQWMEAETLSPDTTREDDACIDAFIAAVDQACGPWNPDRVGEPAPL